MNDNTHSLLGPYVVGAVSADERALFEQHLDACADCRADVAALREATASLADAEATPPPSHPRARVLDQAHRTAQLPPQARTERGAGDSGHRAHDEQTPARPTPAGDVSGAGDASIGRMRRRWAGGLAAAAAVVAIAGVGIGVWGDGDEEPVAMDREIMKVTSAPDATSMDMDLGQSYLVMSDRMDSVVAMGHDAPMPTTGMEYQLWLVMDDGSSHADPTFIPSDDGDFVAMMHTGFEGVSGFAVTEEPMGGSEQPSAPPLATVDI